MARTSKTPQNLLVTLTGGWSYAVCVCVCVYTGRGGRISVFMLLERLVKHGINKMSSQSLLFRLKVKVREPQEKFPFTFEKIEAPEGSFGLP